MATVRLSLRLASEAALPARNFNEATRDRRFFRVWRSHPFPTIDAPSGSVGISRLQRLVWPAVLA